MNNRSFRLLARPSRKPNIGSGFLTLHHPGSFTTHPFQAHRVCTPRPTLKSSSPFVAPDPRAGPVSFSKVRASGRSSIGVEGVPYRLLFRLKSKVFLTFLIVTGPARDSKTVLPATFWVRTT